MSLDTVHTNVFRYYNPKGVRHSKSSALDHIKQAQDKNYFISVREQSWLDTILQIERHYIHNPQVACDRYGYSLPEFREIKRKQEERVRRMGEGFNNYLYLTRSMMSEGIPKSKDRHKGVRPKYDSNGRIIAPPRH